MLSTVKAHRAAGLTGRNGQPWRFANHQVMSLWEMLEVYAREFLLIFKLLAKMKQRFIHSTKSVPNPESYPELRKWNDDIRKLTIKILRFTRTSCARMELDAATPQIDRLEKQLSEGCPPDRAMAMLEDLEQRIEDQFRQRFFMFIPVSKIPYYTEKAIFGEAVELKFPAAIDDVAEAGRCFAVGRYTACVFHLMRVMELGVRAFAEKLGVPEKRIRDKDWGKILFALRWKIDNLSVKSRQGKARKEACSEAWIFLEKIKDAWRNPTMHPKANYSEEDAKEIFDATKAYMNRMAKRL